MFFFVILDMGEGMVISVSIEGNIGIVEDGSDSENI